MLIFRYPAAIFLILFTLLSSASFASESPVEQPFWRAKPKVLNKITEDRAIIVLVGVKPKTKKLFELKMQGGGQIKKSAEQVYERVQKYEDLTQVSDYIKEVRVKSAQNELYIHTEAFKYHARMTMKVMPGVTVGGQKSLKFTVIDGNFKGMIGTFSFEKYKPERTLMGFEAIYEYEKLPMPQFFVEFGLEFVLQKVAARMRSFLENEPSL